MVFCSVFWDILGFIGFNKPPIEGDQLPAVTNLIFGTQYCRYPLYICILVLQYVVTRYIVIPLHCFEC